MPELRAGWRWPWNSRKAHYFDEGEAISLCGTWMYSGPTQGDASSPATPDDCKACRRKLDKRKEQPKG